MPDGEPQTRPRTKRAVPAERGFRVSRPPPPTPPPIVDNDDDVPSINHALRLTEALDAISSAQADPTPPPRGAPPVDSSAASSPEATTRRNGSFGRPSEAARAESPSKRSPDGSPTGRGAFTLPNLPPIRLPIGPPIPWRIGLPVLVVLLAVTVFVARPTAGADSQVSRLPPAAVYPVEQQAPLFTDAQPTAAPTPAAQPLGVPDSGGVGFDVVDVGLKLIAVLALAYGSLMLLKRAGMGGAAPLRGSSKTPGLHVVASLTLAPNRTVHVLKVPGGKTILVGATPNQVNLIADLGELEADDPDADADNSFFEILKGKLS